MTTETRVCNKCGIEKPTEAFSTSRHKWRICKACHATKEREYARERKAGIRKNKPKPQKPKIIPNDTPLVMTPESIVSPLMPSSSPDDTGRKLLIVRGGYAQVAEVTLKPLRAIIPEDDTKYSLLLSHAQSNGYQVVFALEDAPKREDAKERDEE